jgi:hypothetical protein
LWKLAETSIKEHAVATIHLHQRTTATPGQFLAGLTDFWPGRSKIFPNSADGHTYTLTPRPDGTTDVDAVVVRDGKNLKGRLLAILLSTGGKRVLGKALGKTVKAIEARNYQMTAGNS